MRRRGCFRSKIHDKRCSKRGTDCKMILILKNLSSSFCPINYHRNMFPDDRNYVLAVCLADGNIVMLRSFDDVSPITIRTSLKAPLHAEWSNSRKLLAIAGTRDSDNGQASPHEYANLLKFYSVTGSLVYTAAIPYTQVSMKRILSFESESRWSFLKISQINTFVPIYGWRFLVRER